MAKLLFSSVVDGVRGRSGGVIFSANAAGPYIKRFAPPIVSNTSSQLFRRSTFSNMGGLWRSLSNAQRQAWRDYAKLPAQAKTDSLGNTFFLNGWQWFVSCNSSLALVNRSPIANAPVIAVPGAPTIGGLIVTAPGTASNSQAINVASFSTHDAIIEMNWTPNVSKLVASNRNFLFVVGVQNASLVASLDLGNLQSIFGVIQAGSFWISRVYAQTSEGRRGTFVSASVSAV